MQLGEYLKAKKIDVRTFARDIGVSVQSVYRYVDRDRIPNKEVMQRIVEKTHGKVQANDFYRAEAA